MINYSTQLKNLIQKIVSAKPELLDYIREDRYRIADTPFDSRQIRNLEKSNLLSTSRNSNKEWRMFNLNDLLYLHIINYAKLHNADKERLIELKRTFFEQTLNYQKIGEVSFSEIALIALLSELVPIGILMFDDGDIILTDDPQTPFSVGYSDTKQRTFMFIMLHSTFRPYIDDFQKDTKSRFNFSEFEDDYRLKPLKRQESKVIKLLNNEEVSKITITKKQNGKLHVEGENLSKEGKITLNELEELVKGLGYANVEFDLEEGIFQNLKIRQKHRI